MFRFCLVCSELLAVSGDRLCLRCSSNLERLRLSAFDGERCREITSVFRYEEPLRSLVLKAKIRDDYLALNLLLDFFGSAPEVSELGIWCDAVMPAPSSLWGRARGRFDVAFMLARRVSVLLHRPLVTAPNHLYWRFKKRALEEKSSIFQIGQTISESARFRRPKTLVVDDIVTTGFTLKRTASALVDHEIRCLALANAMD
jgi:predicted amidophosphoribosyltransferase